MVVEWGIIAIICFLLNGVISKRLVHSNKID